MVVFFGLEIGSMAKSILYKLCIISLTLFKKYFESVQSQFREKICLKN